jgi:1-acyl-sn-glycerol-3-phosphate acyltransferase
MILLPVPARRVVRVAGFAALTGTMLPAYVARDALAATDDKEAVRDRWIRRWSRGLLKLFSVHVHVEGDVARRYRGRLVVANHRSTIDVGALLWNFGGHMVSRADLARWPLVGAAARKVGTVFVDRGDAMSGASAIRGIRDLLRAGRTVCVFPEGTTFEGDEVRPFHPGAFVAALHTEAEVVPVGIAYERGSGAAFVNESFPAHLARMSAAPPTRVVLRVGTPIAIEEKVRAAELRARAHGAVAAMVQEARAISDRLAVSSPLR